MQIHDIAHHLLYALRTCDTAILGTNNLDICNF